MAQNENEEIVVDEIQKKNDDVVQEEKVIECQARIIAFFAHKGGVSKTTNVHHLGYMLAKKGYKILLVDGDPQQNLSQTCCRTAKNDASWRDNIDRGTIYTALERLHYGFKDGNYIEPANCVRLNKKSFNNGGELYLLPGSLDLAKLEPQITFAHNITNPLVYPLFDDIAGGFRALFLTTCAHYKVDFCLIDMGPSIGELNKSLFWSSDYFLIPCSPDSYCKTTMKTMERTLPLWAEQQKNISKVTQDMTMPLNPVPPKFLGILMGLYQCAGKNKNAVKDSQHWMDIIKQTVKEELVPALSKVDMVHPCCPNDYTLAEIPHFLSLMPIAQRSYCPIYDIPNDGFTIQNDDGEVLSMSNTEISRHKERGEYFYEKYDGLSNLILDMFAREDSVPGVCTNEDNDDSNNYNKDNYSDSNNGIEEDNLEINN